MARAYTVLQKNKQNYFCYNDVKLPPNLTIFGIKMANCLKLYEVHSFFTSPNSRQCTTVSHSQMSQIVTQLCNYKSPVNFQTTYLVYSKPKYGLFSRIISLYNRSFQKCQNLCFCPVFGSEFSKKTGSSVTCQLL